MQIFLMKVSCLLINFTRYSQQTVLLHNHIIKTYAQDFAIFLSLCLYTPERHVKPTYTIYLAYTQYTLALAIQIIKTLLIKLDIVSKPKPQNNQKMSNGGHTNHLITCQWQKVQSIKENVIEVKSLDSISKGNGWTKYRSCKL